MIEFDGLPEIVLRVEGDSDEISAPVCLVTPDRFAEIAERTGLQIAGQEKALFVDPDQIAREVFTI